MLVKFITILANTWQCTVGFVGCTCNSSAYNNSLCVSFNLICWPHNSFYSALHNFQPTKFHRQPNDSSDFIYFCVATEHRNCCLHQSTHIIIGTKCKDHYGQVCSIRSHFHLKYSNVHTQSQLENYYYIYLWIFAHLSFVQLCFWRNSLPWLLVGGKTSGLDIVLYISRL